MARFLHGNALNSAIEQLIADAKQYLILVSPYIKLHSRYASALKTKLDKPDFVLIIVFGKNESDMSRSMQLEDFSFFKKFPNVQISYEPNLHAKYYANEDRAILTSMNLYSFSQDHNIEAGVITKRNILSNLATSLIGDATLDTESQEYFDRVILQSKLVYQREPEFEKVLFGISKKYTGSYVKVDKLTELFTSKLQADKTIDVVRTQTTTIKPGFCIRSGKPIKFNPDRPFSDEAYLEWSKYKNKDYPEKYCHFSGEESDGATTFSKPILRKNWVKAKEFMGSGKPRI